MSIPRYNLYGAPDLWSGNIRCDTAGRWVKWNDITPYLEYCEQQGFQPPEQLELFGPYYPSDIMADKVDVPNINEDDDHELPPDDGEDLYDLMMHSSQKDRDD